MTDQTSAESSEHVQPQPEGEPERQTEAMGNYENAAKLGKWVSKIVREREDSRLTPYTKLEQFDREDLKAVHAKSRGDDITEADVIEAKRGSLALAYEAAFQVSEAQLPRGPIREDTDSLADLRRVVIGGAKLSENLFKEGHKDLVIEQIRNTVARRLKKPPSEVALSDTQLIDMRDEKISSAAIRLKKAHDALSEYLGR